MLHVHVQSRRIINFIEAYDVHADNNALNAIRYVQQHSRIIRPLTAHIVRTIHTCIEFKQKHKKGKI